MLRFLTPPISFKSASDIIGETTARTFRSLGVPCVHQNIWPDSWAKRLVSSRLPGGYYAYKHLVAPLAVVAAQRRIQYHDLVWMNDLSACAKPWSVTFEEQLKRKGARYIFNLHDNWLAMPSYDAGCKRRIELADLVIAVTPLLAESVRAVAPAAPLVTLECPIDVERVRPNTPGQLAERPLVIWTGNPYNIKELPDAEQMLAQVHRQQPFTLRIVTGTHRPTLSLPVPWEWRPYSEQHEAEALAGAWAGLAPLTDSPYARCKDMYKIKTYLAAGVPVIASPVGHNPDVLRHNATGFLVSTRAEWITALTSLLTEPARARAMSLQARADAEQRFSHRVLIPQWVEVLRRYFPDLAAN
jgi:glycosyltransferase involved in cell wall biosynthesis